MTTTRPLVALVKGDDPSLVRDAVRDLVDEAVGGGDRSLIVDDHDDDVYELATAVDAAQTPPMLASHRVVVARGVDRFGVSGLAPLLAYLADPLESTTLILVWGPGATRVPKALNDSLKAAGGETVDAAAPSGRARQDWLDAEIGASGLRLDAAARRFLAEQLADDVARLPGVLEALSAAFGAGTTLGPADIEPFVGEAGSVPPWELTDAIDRGDAATALDKLQRMLGAGGRHPLQLMVTLHAHFERMLRLHGSDATNEAAGGGRARPEGLDVPRPQGARPASRPSARGACPGRCCYSPTPTWRCGVSRAGRPSRCWRCWWPASPGSAADPAVAAEPARGGRGSALGVGREPGDPPHQPALVPRRLVLVDDTLGGGLVDALHRDAEHLGRHVVAVARRGLGVSTAGLQLGTGRLVALTAGLVLAVPLDLGLDVGHGSNDSTRRGAVGHGRARQR